MNMIKTLIIVLYIKIFCFTSMVQAQSNEMTKDGMVSRSPGHKVGTIPIDDYFLYMITDIKKNQDDMKEKIDTHSSSIQSMDVQVKYLVKLVGIGVAALVGQFVIYMFRKTPPQET